MNQYPVKYIHSGMRGVPTVRDTPGSRIAAIDAFLITGFGMVTANAVSVTGGIATASLPTGQSFEPHCIIRIAGATPAALNGEARVLTATDSEITFATDADDGLASGSITIQVAPVGHWEKAFTGPNVAVYRSTHPESLGFYWRVDDSNARHVSVRGYETMSDADTGTGPFPTTAQLADPRWAVTSYTNRPTTWDFVADGRFFIAAFSPGSNGDGKHRAAPPFGFGDLLPRHSADAWAAALAAGGNATNNIEAGSFIQTDTIYGGTAWSGLALPRAHGGTGAAARARVSAYTGNSNLSGGDAGSHILGEAPNAVDGAIEFSPLFARADTLAYAPPRADLPGVLYCPQRNAHLIFKGRDTLTGGGPLAGRRLLALPLDPYASTDVPRGVYFIDTTGPWRH